MASSHSQVGGNTTTLIASQQERPIQDSREEEAESRENPTGLAKILSRARRTSSHSRSPNRYESAETSSTTSQSPSFFSRMTGSTAATAGGHGNGAEHQHHSHGPISALKGVFANRPSSRDRRGGAPEDGMERISSGHPDSERGRDLRVSTGRGGAGNIRAASQSRARDDPDSGEEEARERSRERSRERGHGSGRGGAGNFRSASKNPESRLAEEKIIEEDAEAEKQAHAKRLAEENKHAHSYGRGGAGNIK